MKKIDIDNLFSELSNNEVLKNNTERGATLYKPNLFLGMNNKEKKSLRIKLRRKKDNFISSYIMHKNDNSKLSELKNLWLSYAKNVYVDVNKIIDNNSTTQNKEDALKFLSFINSIEKNDKKDNKKK